MTIGPTLSPDKSLSVGTAAHITAASPGGPRYDPTLSLEQRSSIENAIWLCATCAKLIDSDVTRFTVDLLRTWKAEAERDATIGVGQTAGSSGPVRDEVVALLKKLSPGESADFYFREGYETLQAADPSLDHTIAIEADGVTITSTSKDGKPITVAFDPVFPDTPEGHAKAAEFRNFLENSGIVELTEENVPLDALPAVIRAASKGRTGPMRLRLGPRRPGRMATSLIFRNDAGDTYEFPYIEFATNRFENSDVVLSNAQQCIPFKVELRLSSDRRGNFHWHFDLAGAGFHWIREVIQFQRVLSRPTKIIYRDVNDGIEDRAMSADAVAEPLDPTLGALVDRVLSVQRLTRSRIHVPDRAYPVPEDISQLEFIEFILATGRQRRLVEQVVVTIATTEDLTRLRESIDGGLPFNCSAPAHFELLFNDPVALGPVVIWSGRVTIHSDDQERYQRALDRDVDLPQDFRVVPFEGWAMEARYLAWDPEIVKTGVSGEVRDTNPEDTVTDE